jgi:hypothetical protein
VHGLRIKVGVNYTSKIEEFKVLSSEMIKAEIKFILFIKERETWTFLEKSARPLSCDGPF